MRRRQHTLIGQIAIYTACLLVAMYLVFGSLIIRVLGISDLAGHGLMLVLVTICVGVAFGPWGRKSNAKSDA